MRSSQAFLLLILASAALYLQTLSYGFIQLDDPHHLFENPDFLSPKIATLLRYWIEPFFGLYIPTTYTVWWFLSLFTLNPFFFHLLNFSLHTLNAVLVFLLLKRYSRSDIAALLGALFFQLHPIQVEAVCWISGIKDLLFATFLLLALNLKLRSQKILPDFFFFLALTSKPTAMAGTFLLIALLRGLENKTWKEAFSLSRIWFLLSLPIFAITKWLQADKNVQDLTPIWTRPLVALDSLGFYLTKIIFPVQLALDYGRSPKNLYESVFLSFYIPLGLAFLTLMVWLYKRQRELWMGCLLFLFCLLPNLGLVAFQFQLFSTVADRYAYLSLLGFAFLLSRSQLKYYFTGALLVPLSLLTFQQIGNWKSDTTLFESTLKVNPKSFLSHTNYGFYLFQIDKFEKATYHLGQVVAIRPHQASLRINYASALAKVGRISDSIEQFKMAADLEPLNVSAHFHLGRLLMESGERQEGLAHLRKATELEPHNQAMLKFLQEETIKN